MFIKVAVLMLPITHLLLAGLFATTKFKIRLYQCMLEEEQALQSKTIAAHLQRLKAPC